VTAQRICLKQKTADRNHGGIHARTTTKVFAMSPTGILFKIAIRVTIRGSSVWKLQSVRWLWPSAIEFSC
jgi:hypothetical protein